MLVISAMNTMSQILTVAGLFFEFLSVAYTARKVFPPSKSKKERKQRYYDEIGKTVDQKLASREKEWYIVLVFLFIGMTLQGIALFV